MFTDTKDKEKSTTSTDSTKKDEKELEEMFRAGTHFGYSRSKRHPKMAQYLFGIRNNVEVFDLEQTKEKLDSALNFVRELGSGKKNIVFIGTKPAIRDLTEKMATELSMPFVKERWLGGTLTNFSIIRKRMDYFEDLKQKKSSGELDKYTKKERLDIDKKLEKLDRNFGGLVGLKGKPDALFIIDPKEEKIALSEAQQMKVPTIAIMNSDSNPEEVQYPIPANDDAASSVAYLLAVVVKAYQDGMKEAVKNEKKDEKKEN